MFIFRRFGHYEGFRRIVLVAACCALPLFMTTSNASAYQYMGYSTAAGTPAKWQAPVGRPVESEEAGIVLDVLWVDPADGILKRSQDLADGWLEGLLLWNNAPDALEMYDISRLVEASVDLTGANISTDGSPSTGKIWGIKGDEKVELAHDQDGSAMTVLRRDPDSEGVGQVFFADGNTRETIVDGFAIVRGKTGTAASDPSPTGPVFRVIAIHELGHVLGIGHSAVAMYEAQVDSVGNEFDAAGVLEAVRRAERPHMSPDTGFPTALAPTLKADDLAAISALYPGETFSGAYGTLSGTVTLCRDPAKALSNVNVRAIDTADPRVFQIGRWTDYNGNSPGRFEMAVRKNRSYRLVIESLGAKRAGISYKQPSLRIFTPKSKIDRVVSEYLNASNVEKNCAEDIPGASTDARAATFNGPSGLIDNLDFKAGEVEKIAFAIDTSASMGIEMFGVQDALRAEVTRLEASQDPFPTVAMIKFKSFVDRNLLITSDPTTLRAAIDGLNAQGGTLCGEASNEALIVIGRMLGEGTTVLVLTDEPSNSDGPTKEEVENLYRARGLSIRPMLTGDCGGSITPEITATTTTTLAAASDTSPGEEDAFAASSSVALAAEPTLGVESPTATYSALARETGGSFVAIEPYNRTEYIQAIRGAASSSTGPAITSVTPRKWVVNADSDTVIDVEITGGNTSFNATSTLSFDVPDIIVNSLTVESPRRIIANLTVTAGSVADLMTVTTDLGGGVVEVTGGNSFQHFWQFDAFMPVVINVGPNRMAQGETGDVTVRGALTNFVDGVSTADFGPGVTVNLFRVLDPVTAIANVTVDPAAATGFHIVTVTTGAEVVTNPVIDVFQITPPPAAIPRLASVAPASVARGQTADLAITGLNTGFIDQTSFLDLVGEGVTVNGLTVVSPTEATANVTVALDAPLGYLDAVVVTGGEDAAGLDAFAVIP